jgi:hypothetical protein
LSRDTMMRVLAILLGASLMASLGGCAGIGPTILRRDQFDYNSAISDSWKQQMLNNLVKIRYGDTPVFLDVSNVISQYAVQGGVNVGFGWGSIGGVGSNTQSLNANASYVDRPTVTYTPLSGQKFAQNIMAPIPPTAILNLVQSGYPVDMVFRLAVQAINGIYNRSGRLLRPKSADPEFYQLLERLKRIQDSGAMGIRVSKPGDKEGSVIVFKGQVNEAIEADKKWVREALGLNVKQNNFSVVYGAVAENDREIAILSRSVLEVLTNISSLVEVPVEDVEEKRVTATMSEETSEGTQVPPLIDIHSSREKPGDAFLAIHYRNHWFWIDDTDFGSKSLFTFLYFLFSLTETGGQGGAPIITVPIN